MGVKLFLTIWRTALFLCLSSETSLNIFFAHRTSTSSAFEVITETRYINYLLTYLLKANHHSHSHRHSIDNTLILYLLVITPKKHTRSHNKTQKSQFSCVRIIFKGCHLYEKHKCRVNLWTLMATFIKTTAPYMKSWMGKVGKLNLIYLNKQLGDWTK